MQHCETTDKAYFFDRLNNTLNAIKCNHLVLSILSQARTLSGHSSHLRQIHTQSVMASSMLRGHGIASSSASSSATHFDTRFTWAILLMVSAPKIVYMILMFEESNTRLGPHNSWGSTSCQGLFPRLNWSSWPIWFSWSITLLLDVNSTGW